MNFSLDSGSHIQLILVLFIKVQSDKGNLTGMVLLDLQKAFDTVDHCILINKLQALGFDTCSREWYRSYLTNRKQLVDIAGTLSPFQNVTCGVPHGSILGPLLFLVYVNDMCSAVNCKLPLADPVGGLRGLQPPLNFQKNSGHPRGLCDIFNF